MRAALRGIIYYCLERWWELIVFLPLFRAKMGFLMDANAFNSPTNLMYYAGGAGYPPIILVKLAGCCLYSLCLKWISADYLAYWRWYYYG